MAPVPFKREQRLAFGSAAELYDAVRPSYPSEAVRWLVGETPRRILELGAGTGIFTRVLEASGHEVVAIEPDAEMRARLLARSPDVETYHGEAEAIPLPDASVDAVVCAQAHWWFDPERAYGEIARVIRPGGVFGAIWNTPDSRNALAADLNAIGADVPEPVLGARFSSLEAMSFPHAVTYTHETLLLLVKSRAYFIAAAPEIQQEIEQAVARLAATAPDPFELPYLALARRAVRLDRSAIPTQPRQGVFWNARAPQRLHATPILAVPFLTHGSQIVLDCMSGPVQRTCPESRDTTNGALPSNWSRNSPDSR